jgi:hypothetical protein
MMLIGALLALLSALATSASATLQKRESVLCPQHSGVRLLAVLARRGWWIGSLVLSLLGWAVEAAALVLAPVAVVTTMRSAGRGGLVVTGRRFLHERFGRVELAGVVMVIAGGIVVALSATGAGHAARPISNVDELMVAGGAMLAALFLGRSRNGLAAGFAVGTLGIATALFTKEIGDRVARAGLLHALPSLLATPGPWLNIALSVWGMSMLQKAFQRANAASIIAAASTTASSGLVVVSAALYGHQLASSGRLGFFVVGLAMSAGGAVALTFARSAADPLAEAAAVVAIPVPKGPVRHLIPLPLPLPLP